MMAIKGNLRVVFFYLLIPAICVILVYSFIFAKFSQLNQPRISYQPQVDPYTTTQFESITLGDRKVPRSISTAENYPYLDLTPQNTTLWTQPMEDRYQTEHGQFPLKVIIVPHSHNDPGWLNTYDQYFYHYTFYILDNMVKNLNKYQNMTFIWAEMSFFSRWWDSLHSESTKRNLKKLLKESRFEIVTGGWVMSDEGPAHYFDMLDQLIEGHQFLRTTLHLDHVPHNSWSIDPFGHSGTFPYLLKQSGVDNIYIQRTHFAWKRYLSEKRLLEFFWTQAFNRDSLDMSPLCHMSPLDLYSFKYACGPDIQTCLEFDFRKIFGESSESTAVPLNQTNIDTKAHKILEQYSKLGSLFPHNVALVLLGDDFRYNFELEWQQQYQNYNFLMNHINSNGDKFHGANIQFGTLNDYFEAVHERMPLEKDNYPSVHGDFMPYADVYVNAVPNYWTGYYTTRPYYKALSRELQRWLRATEIIYSLSRSQVGSRLRVPQLSNQMEKDYNLIASARQNLALFQHHDGITGTSKDYVMEDYGHRMAHSVNATMQVLARAIQYLNLDHNAHTTNNTDLFILTSEHKPSWNKFSQRRLLKVPGDENGLRLIVFNSHSQSRTESIKILLEDPFVKLIDVETETPIKFQINPVFTGSALSSSVFELEFIDTLSALSVKNYKVLTTEDNIESKVKILDFNESTSSEENRVDRPNEAFVFEKSSQLLLENQWIAVGFDKKGFMEWVHLRKFNQTFKVSMSFIAYHSEPKQSGAYLFEPSKDQPFESLFVSSTPRMQMFTGSLSSTLLVNYSDISYSITLFNSNSNIGAGIELNVLVNLENKDSYNNQEIALRIATSIDNQQVKNGTSYRTFFVDSNGFQMFERNFVESIGVQGNYYPMTSSLFIEDHQARMTLLSSHSLGCTSPINGVLEVMLDRRIIEDDKRGLSQGVLDNLPVLTSFWLVVEPHSEPTQSQVPTLSTLADSLLLYLNYPATVLYSYRTDREITVDDSAIYFRNRYLVSPNSLCSYFLLNLRTLPHLDNFSHPSNSSLLILHHRVSVPLSAELESACDRTLPTDSGHSPPVTYLFNDLRLVSVQRASLSGMRSLHEVHTLVQLEVPPFEIYSYNVSFH